MSVAVASGAVAGDRSRSLGIGALLALAALVGISLVHLSLGARPLSLLTLAEALVAFDPKSFEHVIVHDLRLPRLLVALSVGAALAVAGALMQGVTRNPLAAPDILGVNHGAATAVVLASGLGVASPATLPWFAFAGALAVSAVVYALGAVGGGATPLKLTLAGVAVSAFLGAVISAAHLLNQDNFERLRVWLAGTLTGRDMGVFAVALPYLLVGLLLALLLARQINALGLGSDVAPGLGVEAVRLRLLALASVVLLAGAAVTVTGPIGFIGLVVPHMVRTFAGVDYRWILPLSAVVGAAVLVAADLVARVAPSPEELATGIVTALVGAPVFVALVRWQVR